MSDQTPTLYRRERYVGQPVPEGGELLSDGAPNGEPTVLIIPVVRCEHGDIDPHQYVLHNDSSQTGMWCAGSPTLVVSDE